jgi:hypothetical protein
MKKTLHEVSDKFEMINLKGAKVDEAKDEQFLLITSQNTYHFKIENTHND